MTITKDTYPAALNVELMLWQSISLSYVQPVSEKWNIKEGKRGGINETKRKNIKGV